MSGPVARRWRGLTVDVEDPGLDDGQRRGRECRALPTVVGVKASDGRPEGRAYPTLMSGRTAARLPTRAVGILSQWPDRRTGRGDGMARASRYQPNTKVAPVPPLPFWATWPLVFLPNWNRPWALPLPFCVSVPLWPEPC